MATTTIVAEPFAFEIILDNFIPIAEPFILSSSFGTVSVSDVYIADEFDSAIQFDTAIPTLKFTADEIDSELAFDTITKRMYLRDTLSIINGLEINGTLSLVNSLNHTISGEISYLNNIVLSVTGDLICKNNLLTYNPIGTRFVIRNYIEGATSTSVGLYHYDSTHGL